MATLDAFSRVITHHSVTIDTRFRTQKIDEKEKAQCICPVPEMLELAKLMKGLKGLKHIYEKGDVVLTLQDINFYTTRQDKTATHLGILVNAVDKNGSTTVLKNITTDTRTEISPKHEEG